MRKLTLEFCDMHALVNTDILVLAITYICTLAVNELWIAFGNGNIICLVMKFTKPLDHQNHQLCQVSICCLWYQFPWQGQKDMLECIERFSWGNRCIFSSVNPSETISEDFFALLEHFVALLYDRISQLSSINDASKELFAKKGRFRAEYHPPPKAALMHHVQKAA